MRSDIVIDAPTAVRAFGQGYFNLLRRGADGSLVLSADRWRVAHLDEEEVRFQAHDDGVSELVVRLAEVERMTWDRLETQRTRSQIRFLFANGDVWSFSGVVAAGVLPPPEHGAA